MRVVHFKDPSYFVEPKGMVMVLYEGILQLYSKVHYTTQGLSTGKPSLTGGEEMSEFKSEVNTHMLKHMRVHGDGFDKVDYKGNLLYH